MEHVHSFSGMAHPSPRPLRLHLRPRLRLRLRLHLRPLAHPRLRQCWHALLLAFALVVQARCLLLQARLETIWNADAQTLALYRAIYLEF